MALQDVCGFKSFCQWNAPLLPSSSLEYTSSLPGRRFGTDPVSRFIWRSSTSSSPMEFYVPVQEYLLENPIEFGQVRPTVNLDWTNLTADDPLYHSSLSDSLRSPIPLSICPSVPLPFSLGHGTTTLGFVFQGGVIAAADSRSSCSGLVACPASQKILPVHSHLVGTTSGTSADCALWKRILARELRLYQLRYRRRLSTGGAAKLLSHMLHPFKGTELCVAATLCGWDGDEFQGGANETSSSRSSMDTGTQPTTSQAVKVSTAQPKVASGTTVQPIVQLDVKTQSKASNKTSSTVMASNLSGPRLFYVCSDGRRLQGDLFSVGSGSPYAYSILDGRIHWGLSVDDAISIAREAVYRATYRDAYSGNNVDLYHVTAKGWSRRKREDLKEEYYRAKERERKRVEERRTGEREKKRD